MAVSGVNASPSPAPLTNDRLRSVFDELKLFLANTTDPADRAAILEQAGLGGHQLTTLAAALNDAGTKISPQVRYRTIQDGLRRVLPDEKLEALIPRDSKEVPVSKVLEVVALVTADLKKLLAADVSGANTLTPDLQAALDPLAPSRNDEQDLSNRLLNALLSGLSNCDGLLKNVATVVRGAPSFANLHEAIVRAPHLYDAKFYTTGIKGGALNHDFVRACLADLDRVVATQIPKGGEV